MLIQKIIRFKKIVEVNKIIRINKRHPIGLDLLKAKVARRRLAAVFLVKIGDVVRITLLPFVNNSRGVVG